MSRSPISPRAGNAFQTASNPEKQDYSGLSVEELIAKLHSRDEQIVILQHQKDEISNDAIHDGLTGFLRNEGFYDQAGKLFQQNVANAHRRENDAPAQESGLCLVRIDLDNFKAVNEGFGHAGGDEVLQFITSKLQDTLKRSSNVFGRPGGDEFAVLLVDAKPGFVEEKLNTLRQNLTLPVPQGSHVLTFSFGTSYYDSGMASFRDMEIEADKNAGKDKHSKWERPVVPGFNSKAGISESGTIFLQAADRSLGSALSAVLEDTGASPKPAAAGGAAHAAAFKPPGLG